MCALLCLLAFSILAPVHVQCVAAQENREFEIKAAFITKFPKFVTWPKSLKAKQGSSLTIGYIGQGPLIENLKALDGKEVEGRVIKVIDANAESFNKPLQILVVSPDLGPDFGKRLKAIRKKGVLIIGDAEGFCDQGGMINFYMKTGKVRFEINIEAVKKAKLKISAKLLRLARIVE